MDQSLSSQLENIELLLFEAMKPLYALDIVVKPDDETATQEIRMYDDDANNRLVIGKLILNAVADYGIWISRRGYNVKDITDPKFFSFTGSALTPKLKYSGVTAMTYGGINGDGWTKTIVANKDFIDENLIILGFFKSYFANGSTEKTTILNPYEFRELNPGVIVTNTSVTFGFDVTPVYFDDVNTFNWQTDPNVTGVDLEYFIFSDR